MAAQAAQTAAETAQGKAEDAQAAAEDAVASVSGLSGQIEQNTSDIADLQDIVDRKAGALVDSASGSIVSVYPDKTVPNVYGLTVYIEPVQAGSGDPSPDNVRPITGWTGAKVTRTGKNLIYPKYSGRTNNGVTYTVNENGTISASGTATGGSYAAPNLTNEPDKMILLHAGTYYLSGGKSANKVIYLGGRYVDGTVFSASYDRGTGAKYVFTKDVYVYPQINIVNGTETDDTFYIQLELGSTATSYELYQGETYDITFPTEAGTVYGGTDDVVGGGLTDEWAEIPSYNGETITEPWLSSMDAYTPGATPTTGAQVVYKLTTPITYHLPPQEVSTIAGLNNILADTGDVSVEYAADLKHYIDTKIAAAVAALS